MMLFLSIMLLMTKWRFFVRMNRKGIVVLIMMMAVHHWKVRFVMMMTMHHWEVRFVMMVMSSRLKMMSAVVMMPMWTEVIYLRPLVGMMMMLMLWINDILNEFSPIKWM